MVDAMLELMPTAQVWHLGLFRDERTLRPVEYYNKLPDSATVDLCLILDPMLATGGSATAAIEVLKKWGAVKPVRIKLVNLIAAPEGVEAVVGGPPRRRDLLRRARSLAQREGLHPARPRRRRRPPVRDRPLGLTPRLRGGAGIRLSAPEFGELLGKGSALVVAGSSRGRTQRQIHRVGAEHVLGVAVREDRLDSAAACAELVDLRRKLHAPVQRMP